MFLINYIQTVFLSFQQEKISDYTNLTKDIYSPLYISILIFLLLIVFIYASYRHVYNPILKKRREEQQQFEVNTSKLLALFSELDPNPILRIDPFGEIKGINKSAKILFPAIKLDDTKIKNILPEMNFNFIELIREDKTITKTIQIDDRFYEVNCNGISFLDMAQLYFWDITSKKSYDEQMKHYQNLLRSASINLQVSIEDERNRISKILHNSIAQNILLIKMNVSKYKNYIQSGLNGDEVDRTLEILESTLNETRSLAHELKPMSIDQLGLFTALKSTCYNVAKESGLTYDIQIPEQTINLGGEVDVCIYRVVQEALNNILRHSKAKSFNVKISIENHTLTLYVSDDGIGFSPRKLINDKYISDGMGLMSMQESVERLNGTFEIESSENLGTVIMASFPLKQKNDVKPGYQNISS